MKDNEYGDKIKTTKLFIRFEDEMLWEVERVMWILEYVNKEDFLLMVIQQWLDIYNGDINQRLINKLVVDDTKTGKWKQRTKYKGIYHRKGKFQVYVKDKYLMTCETQDEAIKVREDYIKNNNIKYENKL